MAISAPGIAFNGYSEENPQFTLYSHHIGPNGWKAAQALSELGLTYRTIFLEFGNDQNGMKTSEFERVNPNGRIPALVDHSANDLTIWESGAILLYLVKKYDTTYRLWARTLEDQALIETWLLFQVSGQGPYLGQAMWFAHYHSEIVPSAQDRYVGETRRVLRVLAKQLGREGSKGWLVLGRFTVADLSFLQWYLHAYRIGINIQEEYPVVWEWLQRMQERPAVAKANVGSVFPKQEFYNDSGKE
ncbi:glutathione S-transferase C-terminal-like protein [Choiromyces venosus 120613-1]|uniref:Glutathione S-transferase C-terminal-like protein n=1 Tax=Choiromyces venosus 120613-1 TaxID=1336337 RepID=A0A3N4JDA9_9PEZI|nr:glutathione S-transferase C-terminal-like protein [Choiromyces venosus 120613-1]